MGIQEAVVDHCPTRKGRSTIDKGRKQNVFILRILKLEESVPRLWPFAASVVSRVLYRSHDKRDSRIHCSRNRKENSDCFLQLVDAFGQSVNFRGCIAVSGFDRGLQCVDFRVECVDFRLE